MLISRTIRQAMRRAGGLRCKDRKRTSPPQLAQRKSPKKLLPNYDEIINKRTGDNINLEKLILLHGCPLHEPSMILLDLDKRNNHITLDELKLICSLHHPHRTAIINTLRTINKLGGIKDRRDRSAIAFPLLKNIIKDPLTLKFEKKRLREKWLSGTDVHKFNLIALQRTDLRKAHEEAMKVVSRFPNDKGIWKMLLSRAQSPVFMKNIHSAYRNANSIAEPFSGSHVDVHTVMFSMGPKIANKDGAVFSKLVFEWYSDIRRLEESTENIKLLTCEYMRYLGHTLTHVMEVLSWYPNDDDVLTSCSYSITRQSLIGSKAVILWYQKHHLESNLSTNFLRSVCPSQYERTCCSSLDDLREKLVSIAVEYESCVIPDVEGCLSMLKNSFVNKKVGIFLTFSVLRRLKQNHPTAHEVLFHLVKNEMIVIHPIHLFEEVYLKEASLRLSLGIAEVPKWLSHFTNITVGLPYVRALHPRRGEQNLSFYSVVESLWFLSEFFMKINVKVEALVSQIYEKKLEYIPSVRSSYDSDLCVMKVVQHVEEIQVSKTRARSLSFESKIIEEKVSRKSDGYLLKPGLNPDNNNRNHDGIDQPSEDNCNYDTQQSDSSDWNTTSNWDQYHYNTTDTNNNTNWDSSIEEDNSNSNNEKLSHNIERATDDQEDDDDNTWYERIE